MSALAKEQQLAEWLRRAGSVLIGYSGGVDSAYLACVAVETLGRDRVLGVIGRSPSYSDAQWTTARAVATHIGLRVEEVDTQELNDVQYAANPTNRCYFCKTELWGRLWPIARERGMQAVLDGTNADDLGEDRPGAAAGREQGVQSPLAETGLTKSEIRDRSRARRLPTWDQPSSPCLASRIPHGTPVTVGRLRAVEEAERSLRALGVAGNLRVRHHGATARVEMDPSQLDRWLAQDQRGALEAAVRLAGYTNVVVDPAGYRAPLSRA